MVYEIRIVKSPYSWVTEEGMQRVADELKRFMKKQYPVSDFKIEVIEVEV